MESNRKQQTRALILAGAGRTFRSHGYDGSGVDGVAKAAGVTSGAFYAHFKSKADAFRETVLTGLQDLETAIRSLRAESESGWVEQFVDFYLGEKRTCALTESCALVVPHQVFLGPPGDMDDLAAAFEKVRRLAPKLSVDGLKSKAKNLVRRAMR